MFQNSKVSWLIVVAGLLMAIGLRFGSLMAFPPALYWEEVALGFDAYSIATTAKDHHGQFLPVVAFKSFGDYKPTGYFYLIVPFIWLMGLQPEVVRLPSAVSGIVIVGAIGGLAYWLWPLLLGAKSQKNLSLRPWFVAVSVLISAVSPWLIQFSRAGWEVNAATAMVTLAMFLGAGILTQSWSSRITKSAWLVMILLLVMSMYTYHATRLLAPLLGGLVWILFFIQSVKDSKIAWWQVLRKQLLWWIVCGVVAIVLLLPLGLASRTPEVQQRVAQTSIFSQFSIIEQSNAYQAQYPGVWSKLIFHRYVLFGKDILSRYLSHFDLKFLFLSGDSNARHSIQYLGQLYHLEVIPLVIGIYALWKRKSKAAFLVVGWWLLSIIPAAMTFGTPHALRTLPGVPAIMLLLAVGWWEIGKWFWRSIGRLSWLVIGLVVVFYLVELGMFGRYYTQIYPQVYGTDWKVGYAEMVAAVNELKTTVPNQTVWLTREQGRPMMYYWFFSKTDPRDVQAVEATAKQDLGEFLSFENVRAVGTIDEITSEGIVASSEKGWLTLQQRGKVHTFSTIRDRRGETIWIVYRYQPN